MQQKVITKLFMLLLPVYCIGFWIYLGFSLKNPAVAYGVFTLLNVIVCGRAFEDIIEDANKYKIMTSLLVPTAVYFFCFVIGNFSSEAKTLIGIALIIGVIRYCYFKYSRDFYIYDAAVVIFLYLAVGNRIDILLYGLIGYILSIFVFRYADAKISGGAEFTIVLMFKFISLFALFNFLVGYAQNGGEFELFAFLASNLLVFFINGTVSSFVFVD